jgi:transcription antitermination factor NusB
MKGRRRARRLALQALYELDQSGHGLERVIHFRVLFFLAEHLPRHVEGVAPARAPGLARRLAPSAAQGSDALDLDLVPPGSDARALAGLVEQAAYGARIVRGAVRDRAPIDEVITVIAPEWPVDQMAPVDRNILRIALWEIATAVTPERVAISEAVEMAREFSGESSRRMVNGALGAYAARESRLNLSDARLGGADA